MNSNSIIIIAIIDAIVIAGLVGYVLTRPISSSTTITNTVTVPNDGLIVTTPPNTDEQKITSPAYKFTITLPAGFSFFASQETSPVLFNLIFSEYNADTSTTKNRDTFLGFNTLSQNRFALSVYALPTWDITDVAGAKQWSKTNRPSQLESAEVMTVDGRTMLRAIEPDANNSKAYAYYVVGPHYLYILSSFDFPDEAMRFFITSFVSN